jgi:hypothetical protein
MYVYGFTVIIACQAIHVVGIPIWLQSFKGVGATRFPASRCRGKAAVVVFTMEENATSGDMVGLSGAPSTSRREEGKV